MEKALLVDVKNGLNQLFCDMPDFPLFQFTALLLALSHQLVEILFDVFEHKVGFVDHTNDLLEFDYVRVIHLAKSLHLRQLQALLPSSIFFLEPLDGNDLLGGFVFSHLDVTEGARA